MILAICGPTGVGKTKLSLMLAKKYNAIVINFDAVQIYKGLDIGSAKISKDEMGDIKHYLIDIKTPDEEYSIADFQKDARYIIDNNKDKNIVMVGGTGLYLCSALMDYKFMPSNKNEDFEKYSNEELYEMAKKINPDCDIHKNNKVRLIRFLEREGKCYNDAKLIYDDIYFIGLTTDRQNLYNKTDQRIDKMINDGLILEVKNLYQKYPDSKILHRAIGYKEIIDYLDNKISLDYAIFMIKLNTHHYIKRQYTWFNNKMNVMWFDTDYDNFNNTFEMVNDYIKKSQKLD